MTGPGTTGPGATGPGATGPSDWSPPRIVNPHAPRPIVTGEMVEVRRSWRAERRARAVRKLWPAFVVALLLVIIGCAVLLIAGPVLRF